MPKFEKLFDDSITLVCTKDQKKAWKAYAKSKNKTLSEWIRNTLDIPIGIEKHFEGGDKTG